MADWIVDPQACRLRSEDSVCKLEPMAMDVLVFLLQRAPEPVPERELLERFWPPRTSEQRKVAKRISQIRTAFGDNARTPTVVETVSKRGYRIVAEIDLLSESPERWLIRPQADINHSKYQANAEALELLDNALRQSGSADYSSGWLTTAIKKIKRAVSIDEEYEEGWAYLAVFLTLESVRGDNRSLSAAIDAADKALQLNPKQPIALMARGYSELLFRRDTDSAEKNFVQAMTLSPDNPEIMTGYQLLLRVKGQFTEAHRLARRINRLAPHDLKIRPEQIKFHYELRLYDDAIRAAQMLRNLIPGYADFAEAAALERLGRFSDSFKTRLQAYEYLGEKVTDHRRILIEAYDSGGYGAAMKALTKKQLSIAESLGALAPHEFVPSESAIDDIIPRLRRETESGYAWTIGLNHSPEYDSIRQDARFTGIVEQLGLSHDFNHWSQTADLARVEIFRGETRPAIDTLLTILDQYPDDSRINRCLESLGWGYWIESDWEACISFAKDVQVFTDNPYLCARAWLLEALAQYECDNFVDAAACYASACRIWPENLNIETEIMPLFIDECGALGQRLAKTTTELYKV